MLIFVDSPTKNHYLLVKCETSDLVSQLKAKIETKEGISASQQALAFRGKILKDNKRLEEYNIKEKAVLFLELKETAKPERILTTDNVKLGLRGLKRISPKKYKTHLENVIKQNGSFLPKEYSSIENLKSIFQGKIQNKKDKYKWNQLITHEGCNKKNMVTSVAVTSDNKYIVSASADRSIKIFNLQTKQDHHHFKNAHLDSILSVAVSNSEGFLVSGSADKSIKIFDLNSKQELHHFKDAHSNSVRSIAVSYDNKFIVSSSDDRSIKIFNIQQKEEEYHFKDVHADRVRSVVVSNLNRFIVSGSNDRSIKIFDFKTKQEYHHFKDAHHDSVTSVSVSNDNKFIFSGSLDNSIKIFDIYTKQEHYHFKDAQNDSILSVGVSNDNRFIFSASLDNSIKIYDIQTKQAHQHFKKVHTGQIISVAVSKDNTFIVSGSADKTVKIFELQTKQEYYHFKDAHKEWILSVAVSSNNSLLVSGSFDKSIKVFDLQTKQQYHHFKDAHKNLVISVAISKDNRFIVSGSDDRSIKIFDIQSKEEYHHFKDAHNKSVLSVTVSNNNKFIASGSDDKSIKLFDFKNKKEIHHFKNAHNDSILSVLVSSDNRFIVSGSADKSIKMFEIESKQVHHYFKDAHNDVIRSVAISNDNTYIVSGSDDKSIKIFDLQNKKECYHFKDTHKDSVRSVVFSKDNRFIISGSDDRSIKIFDFKNKCEHYQFKDAHGGSISSITVSNDSKFIISGSEDKSIKIFSIPITQESEIFYVSEKFPFISNSFIFENYLLSSAYPESFKHFAIRYHDLDFSPYYWTILHIVCIFQNLTAIGEIPPYSEFKVPFLLDRYGKTPLHYLVSQENIHYPSTNIILNYILDYIEDHANKNPYELEMIFKSLTPLLTFILSKINPKIRDRFLKVAFMPSSSLEEIPLFGSPQTQPALSHTSIMHTDTKALIYKEGSEQVMFKTTMLHLHYDPALNDMYNLTWLLLFLKDEDVFKSLLVSHLVNYLWDKTLHVLAISALVYCVYMILLTVYLIIGDRVLWLEIPILNLAVLLLIRELIQLFSPNKRDNQIMWNIIDICQILSTVAFIVMRLTDNDDDLAIEWVSSIVIVIGYKKWGAYLRLFKPTRNFIHVVNSIMRDMGSFIIIIAFIMTSFTLVFFQFNREREFPEVLFETYQILYGNYDTTDATLSEKLLGSFVLFILNVVFLNLLISIMGDSYDKIQERRVVTDAVTRLEMVLEVMSYMRVFKKGETQEKGFLIYCLPEREEEDNSPNNEWEGKVNLIKKLLKQNEQKIEEAREMTAENIGKIEAKIEEKIDKKIARIEKKIEEKIEKEVSQVRKLVENSHQEIMKTINQLVNKK